ncbi:MAG: MFS transporter [Pseudolabrys sp.]|nr:MFS transporter [Pseudolabrys sp.]MCW5683252.1 MFS transporter [Pseudolabrys sp.]
MTTSIAALNAVNFFMADVRDGLGPYLGVYLQQKNWSPAAIGLVMTVGGIAGMIATVPFGALVDATRAKRALMAIAAVATVVSSCLILVFPSFTATTIAQVASGIAGAVIAPAIAGLTLGLVHQRGFAHQMGRNEAYNHAGNVIAALLCGLFGYLFGLVAVFVVMGAMAVLSLIALTFINPKDIDHRAARGAAEDSDAPVQGIGIILSCKPLLVLAVTMLLFHLGNGAMLPLLGQSLASQGADPSAYTSATIIVAQLTMIPMALAAAWLAERRGYWIVLILALVALPVRGGLAAVVTGPIGLFPVQMLDGVGAGLLGVAVPGLVARIMAGTGRVNLALGAVMTLQGIGASFSPSLGGWVAGEAGYAASFLALGAVACVALVLWLVATPLVAASCSVTPGKAALERV